MLPQTPDVDETKPGLFDKQHIRWLLRQQSEACSEGQKAGLSGKTGLSGKKLGWVAKSWVEWQLVIQNNLRNHIETNWMTATSNNQNKTGMSTLTLWNVVKQTVVKYFWQVAIPKLRKSPSWLILYTTD